MSLSLPPLKSPTDMVRFLHQSNMPPRRPVASSKFRKPDNLGLHKE
jgi:hypothetical protein